MKFKEFIQKVAEQAQFYIEKYEEYKELSGEQKKARVDDAIQNYIELVLDEVKLNPIVKFIIKKVIIENVSTITQIVFDLLTKKVQGITK